MKTLPVTKNFDKTNLIGEIKIDIDNIPTDRFCLAPGFVKKKGSKNIKDHFELTEMSLIPIDNIGRKYFTHVHDESCPKCGFPETIICRDIDMKPLFIYCSKKDCDWMRKIL